MKATRTDTRCDSTNRNAASAAAFALAAQVSRRFGGRSVYEIAAAAGLKIVYERWFPATFGELDWRRKTIVVNENAAVPFEKIVAHELGHYFLKEYETEFIADEEKFCDEFADELLKLVESAAKIQSQ